MIIPSEVAAEQLEHEQLAIYGEAARLILAKRKAVQGDPFPLVELLWGRIIWADDVVADPTLALTKDRHIILDDFQADILRSLFDPTIRETFVKGNTGWGKNAVIGIAVCLYYLVHNDAKVVLARDSYETAKRKVFSEVSAWWKRMAYKPRYVELQTAGIVDRQNVLHEVTVASPDSDEGFSGTHSPHVLFVFDEATAPVLNARFILAVTQATSLLAMANPRTMSGEFRRAFTIATDPNVNQTLMGPNGIRRLVTVNGKDICNVRARCLKRPIAPTGGLTIEGQRFEAGQRIPDALHARLRPIIPGQTCFDEYVALLNNADPRFVRWAAHGMFPDEDPDKQVILGGWLTQPVHLWTHWHQVCQRAKERRSAKTLARLCDSWFEVESFGLDVGGSSAGDPSVLTAGGRRGIREQISAQIANAPELVEWVCATIKRQYGIDITQGGIPVCVDTDGIGWGVAGMLSAAGAFVLEFRGNESSDVDPKKYANKRAEAYGELGRRLNPDGEWKDQPLLVCDNPFLREELTAPEKLYSTDGHKFGISPKRQVPGVKHPVVTVKDKIGRSPDYGDSAVYWWRAQQAVGMSLEKFLDAGFF